MPEDIARDAGKPGPHAWAVVNTQPNRELVAVENLARQDFEPYCPMIVRRIRHARRTIDGHRPMFPGYLFVRIHTAEQQWRPILSTVGIRGLVRFGSKLGFIDGGFIESLRAREADGAVSRPETPYVIGQKVRIAGGPFDGLVASIVSMDDRNRLGVLMQLLNGEVKASVEATAVVAV